MAEEDLQGAKRSVRSWRRWALVGIVAILFLPLLALGALQLSPVSTALTRAIVARVQPGGIALSVGRVTLRGLTRVSIDDLVVTLPGTADTALGVRRARARLALIPLLRDTLVVRTLQIDGPYATLRQSDEGLRLLPPAEGDPSALDDAPWTIRVEEADVSDGALDIELTPDSLLEVRSIELSGLEIVAGREFGLSVAQGGARVSWSGGADGWAEASVRGLQWDPHRVRAEAISVRTEGSRITGQGTFALHDGRIGAETGFELRVDPLRYADLGPFLPSAGPGHARGGIVGRHDAGALAFDLDLEGDDGGRVALTGTVEGGVTRRLRVRGHVRNVDPSRIVALDGSEGRIALRLDADLTGDALAALGGRLDIDVEPSRLGEWTLDGFALRSRLEGGQGDLSFSGSAPTASAEGSGTLDLTGESPVYALTSRVVLEPAAGPSLAATLDVRGRGTPGQGRLDFDARLDSARIGNTVFDGGRARGEMDGTALDGTLELRSGPGRITARVTGSPLGDDPRLRVDRGRITHADLRSLGAPDLATDLNGAFRGDVEWGAERPRLRLAVDVDSSTVRDATLHAGRFDLRLDGQARIAGGLDWNEGRVDLVATGDVAADPVRYQLREARFLDLDIGSLLTDGRWETALTGSLRAEGVGLDPRTLSGTAELALGRSRLNDGWLEEGRLSVRAERGRWLGQAAVRTQGGSATVDADGALDGAPSYAARGAVDLPRLGSFLGDSASVVARFTAEGTGASLAELTGAARLDVDRATWRTIQIDSAQLDLRAAEGFLTVDTLWARSNVAYLDGGGPIPIADPDRAEPAEADFRLAVVLASLEPVQAAFDLPPLSAAEGTAGIRVVGPADSVRVSGEARVGALLLGSTAVVGLDATAALIYRFGAGWHAGEAAVALDRIGLPTATVERTEITGAWEPDEDIRIAADAVIDGRREARLRARLDPFVERPALALEEFTFRVDEDRWTLTQPTLIHYGPDVRVEPLTLEAPGQRIEVEGTLDESGLRAARVALDSVRVETVADLVGFENLRGTLSGRLEVAGTGDEATGQAEIDFHLRSEPTDARLRANAEIQGGRAAVYGSVEVAGSDRLDVSGSLPLDFASDESMTLRVRAESFRLGLANAFLDPELAREVEGFLDGDVELTGSPRSPRLTGSAQVRDARVRLPATGRTYSAIRATATMEGETVHLQDLHARSGEGTATADGRLHLQQGTVGRYDVSITLDQFHAIGNQLVNAVVSGDLAVNGTLDAPMVTGSVSVDRGDVFLSQGMASDAVEDVTLTEEDYAELEAYFGMPIRRQAAPAPPLFEAMGLNLGIEVRRDVWLRQSAHPELAIQLTGDVRLEKEPGPDFRILGELQSVPQRSYVEQFGRRFQLREGVMTFRGAPLDTRVDLEATYDVPSRRDDEPEVVVVLGVEGEVGNLRILLGSEPTMENADVVSYLATGRPASRSFEVGDEGGGIVARGGDLALDQVTGLIETAAAEKIGLDVVEIRREGLDGATLIAGRYVSPALYLGFQQPVAFRQASDRNAAPDDRTRIEIELQAYRWLLLNLQSGGDAVRFFLRVRYGY